MSNIYKLCTTSASYIEFIFHTAQRQQLKQTITFDFIESNDHYFSLPLSMNIVHTLLYVFSISSNIIIILMLLCCNMKIR